MYPLWKNSFWKYGIDSRSVGQAGFGGGTLPRCHRHIAHRGHLKLAVNTWCKFYPLPVWVWGGAETTSEENSHSQISVAETVRIPDESKGIRRGLIIESISWIQRQALLAEPKQVNRGGFAVAVVLVST